MIVPMKKVQVMIYHRVLKSFLKQLEAAGMMHIDIRRGAEDAALAGQAKRIGRMGTVIKQMARIDVPSAPHNDPFSVVREWENLLSRKDQTAGRIQVLTALIRKQEIWGDFSPLRLKAVCREAGITVRLCVIPRKQYDQHMMESKSYAVVRDSGKKIYLIIFDFDTGVPADLSVCSAEDVPLPEKSLSELREELLQREHERDSITSRQRGLAQYREAVSSGKSHETASLEFAQVMDHLPDAVEGKIYILNGWIPARKTNALEEILRDNDVAYTISRPEPNETVPVLMGNSPFAKLFEPITRLFDLPNYREIDLTAYFAPFFALFFGLCLGDAGYGLVIVAASFFAKRKVTAEKKGFCTLGIILGASTFVIGLITGNMFGANTSQVNLLKSLVFFNQNQLFNLALAIGLFHVLFGMVLKAVNMSRQYGFTSSFSTIGWILMIIGGLVKFGAGLPVGLYVILTGILLILFFNDLKANIFIRIGKGLWELYGITGVVGDILSYVRLFALGISGAILGFVVNDIAGQIRGIPWIGFPVALLFLVAGHTGNLLICSLGSFVHPLRLTFVEFYKSAGFAGGGKAYRPFGAEVKSM